jgi:RNA polymerase sigma factor (sigma-70 family)
VVVTLEPVAAPWPSEFVDLYRAQYGRMVKVAYLLTGSNDVAEELVQDAFVRVRGRIGQVENPVGYLRATVVNACRNFGRHVGVERRHHQSERVPELLDSPDLLADALAKLSPRQRAALVLRYYDGLSEAEIAVALACRPGTVKSTTSRALAELRKVIEP